jgi:four helix bundle protein
MAAPRWPLEISQAKAHVKFSRYRSRSARAWRRGGVAAYRRSEEKAMKAAKHFRDLDVYQNAMAQVMRVFELTKDFPADERFALTDQMRRSSRSVCANIAEAWRKRRYRAAFIAKLNDAEAEAAETQVHLEVAFRHGYLNKTAFDEFDDGYEKVIAQLVKMIDQASSWIIKPRRS